LPQHNVWAGDTSDPKNYNNLVINWFKPGKGMTVKVWFGERLYFDDIIGEHEAKYGPMHKVDAGPIAGKWQQEVERWKSSESDRQLYHEITNRIQDALLQLETRAKKDVAANPVDNLIVACPRCTVATAKGKIVNLRSGNSTRSKPYVRRAP